MKQKLLNASVGLLLMLCITILAYRAIILKNKKSEEISQGIIYPDKNYFFKKIIPIIWTLECGEPECKKLCVPDSGHISCGGVHYPANPEFFISILNLQNQNLKKEKIKNHLWEKYATPYMHCRSEAFIWLVDTAILQGRSVANKLLTEDCDKYFNQIYFFQKRKAHLKKLKAWKKYGKGWSKRLNDLIKYSWNLHKDQMLTIDEMTTLQKKYIKIGIAAFSSEWLDMHGIAMQEIYKNQRPARGVVAEDQKQFLSYLKNFY